MKYGLFDNGGLPLGFYTPDIHGPLMLPIYGPTPEPSEDNPQPVASVVGEERNPAIPDGVVAITNEQWGEFINNSGRRRWDGEGVVAHEPPVSPPPVLVPSLVDDWQFAGQAAQEGIITHDEALEWSGAGVLPPTLAEAVNRLITDEDQRFNVTIFLRGAKSYPREHSLVPLLGRVFGKTDDAALDAFWIAAGQR
ncbi:hypothetical protein MPPM_2553 [Methylorubrum populi]|uniref:Uncharacterized protein n=1 Tax=Methylorubrum populi TaxID=223967 RepID=A0A169R248_9HYPH|nr:hypothetical protein [Methylorubrum populi]BAU91158.1 hypothetical protein MPPM_2553 [Methylorubrum populi]